MAAAYGSILKPARSRLPGRESMVDFDGLWVQTQLFCESGARRLLNFLVKILNLH